MTARSRILEKKLLKQSIATLIISVIASIISGVFLGKSEQLLLLVPGLIILIPGAIDLRGNIFAALGSRIGSALHLGLAKAELNLKNKTVTDNIYSTFTLNLSMSAILGILAWLISTLIGVRHIGVSTFVFISVIGGLLSGIILLFITFLFSFKSFKRGWDPDNIVAPLIATIGDFITIPILLLVTYLSFDVPNILLVSVVIVIITTAHFLYIYLSKKEFTKIISQSILVLIISGFLSSISGVFIESDISYFIALPGLLVLFPAFIAQGGNIGNIFASRISTKLHLGTISLTFDRKMRKEIINMYVISIIIFPALGLFSYIASAFSGIVTMSLLKLTELLFISGIILTAIVIFASFFMALLSFRFNWDPDNTLIPIVTSVADILGVYALLLVINVIGVV